MTLTHEEIAKMTCMQVNIAIDNRLDKEVGLNYPDYCHDWSKAGELLEMMREYHCTLYTPKDMLQSCDVYTCVANTGKDPRNFVYWHASTAPEAIARCWLEWYEVKNAAKNEVKHETK